MIYYLIYVSDSSNFQNKEEILDTVSIRNNTLNISGFLVFKNGNFLQLLEGDKAAVINLFSKIKKDMRHKNVTQILENESLNRIFDDYESGFLVPKNQQVLDQLKDHLLYLKLLESPKLNSTIAILENILSKM